MKLASLATLLAVVCTPLVAHAEEPQAKSESGALALSIGATATSYALMFAGAEGNNDDLATAGLIGTFVAPSLGHWYAGDVLTPGLGIRAVSAVAVVAGIGQSLSCFGNEDGGCESGGSAGALISLGLIGYAAGSILDIATAPKAVRDYNESIHIANLGPTALPSSNGTVALGVGIGGSF